jgi:hypothetical protein
MRSGFFVFCVAVILAQAAAFFNGVKSTRSGFYNDIYNCADKMLACPFNAWKPFLHFISYSFSLFNYSFNLKVPTMMVATATKVAAMKTYDSPDFYWKYRLERLTEKKGGDLAFLDTNYPEAESPRDSYEAYYLDLTLQGKMEGFDWLGEKEINDAEWITIYKNMCKWSASTYAAHKPDASNLPTSDFDLLKQFYPQLDYRELDVNFSVEEVGEKFPYASMKDLMDAAVDGSISVPGYSKGSIMSLEATEVRAELKVLQESTMAKLDSIYAETMTYANNAFPDAQAKSHYQDLKKRLAEFPSSAAGWTALRSNMEKEVDEMARLASKKEEEHHGHHEEGEGEEHKEEESGQSKASKEFEVKYGRNLEEMQDRMNQYKADPEGFLQASIYAKYGKDGVDVWKKSQEFSAQMSVMSEADKMATEASFTSFLNQA